MPGRQRQRNLHACHPIMNKGGVHEKSKGAKRAADKRETRRKTREWLGRSMFFWSLLDTGHCSLVRTIRLFCNIHPRISISCIF